NLIAQFIRVISKILLNCIPHVVLFYINDVKIKSSKSFYNYKKVLLKIRKFVLKYI
ncbi:hypothetical protein DL98DRAFT_431599, partial [Cadophora sp. DSE1049]